jgi:streptogramin lyase
VVGGGIDEANGNQMLAVAGAFAALPDETKIVRVATDTAIHFKADGSGAANTDPMLPANSVEYFGVGEGATPSFIAA